MNFFRETVLKFFPLTSSCICVCVRKKAILIFQLFLLIKEDEKTCQAFSCVECLSLFNLEWQFIVKRSNAFVGFFVYEYFFSFPCSHFTLLTVMVYFCEFYVYQILFVCIRDTLYTSFYNVYMHNIDLLSIFDFFFLFYAGEEGQSHVQNGSLIG